MLLIKTEAARDALSEPRVVHSAVDDRVFSNVLVIMQEARRLDHELFRIDEEILRDLESAPL